MPCQLFNHSDASRRSKDSALHRWTINNTLVFETNSNWGFPKALSLRVSSLSKSTEGHVEESNEPLGMGCGFADLCPIWQQMNQAQGQSSGIELRTKIHLFDTAQEFDQHGDVVESSADEVRAHCDVCPAEIFNCQSLTSVYFYMKGFGNSS